MAINLEKGQRVNVNLPKFVVGLGWDANASSAGQDFDLDASVFILGENKKLLTDSHFVFYNNLETEGGNVLHLGDCLTPEGKGDNERIQVVLDALGFEVDRIVFVVTVHNSRERAQGLDVMSSAYMRIIDIDNNLELIRLDLDERPNNCDAVIMGEMFRDISGWRFRALNQTVSGGLYAIAAGYGVNVAPN